MHLSISHLTRYRYDRAVRILPHLLYLRPQENPWMKVHDFALALQPGGQIAWMRDDWDNLAASVQFADAASELEIRSTCEVTTADVQPFDFPVRDYAQAFPFTYEPLHRYNLGVYLEPPDKGVQAALTHWLDQRFTDRPRETVAWLFALNRCLAQSLTYRRRDEPGIQSPRTTIMTGSGSCRDYAQLLIGCVRTFGIAARFVSGYVFDSSRDGVAAGEMHAWVEIFLPAAGWKALDPTYGIFCHNGYVPVAHAVVAESINPVQGSFSGPPGAQGRMTAEVFVRRLSTEDGRSPGPPGAPGSAAHAAAATNPG